MNYQETISYLYQQMPVYEQVGSTAYKPGLERVDRLLALLGDPHKEWQSVHIAGTNGKGSTSSMLASILQEAGYKVGLFTSPHLVDFRERIRVNGEMISEAYVVQFVADLLPKLPSELKPSFFEFTTAMAFAYFAHQGVDIAVVEVGMGGRLDSTNVIKPLVSVITNVTIDHAAYLGETLREIATEKAGIIKPNRPIVLGNSKLPEILEVVTSQADELHAPLLLADRKREILMYLVRDEGGYLLTTEHYGTLTQPLEGSYQIENSATVLSTVIELTKLGLHISDEAVKQGMRKVDQVGLRGRLEVLQQNSPKTIIDTGHNPGAWDYLGSYLEEWQEEGGLVIVLGLASDKDADFILRHLPPHAYIVFTQAKTDRARPAVELCQKAKELGLERCYALPDISTAYEKALEIVAKEGCRTLFIGGSNFIVGEFLQSVYKYPSEDDRSHPSPPSLSS